MENNNKNMEGGHGSTGCSSVVMYVPKNINTGTVRDTETKEARGVTTEDSIHTIIHVHSIPRAHSVHHAVDMSRQRKPEATYATNITSEPCFTEAAHELKEAFKILSEKYILIDKNDLYHGIY